MFFVKQNMQKEYVKSKKIELSSSVWIEIDYFDNGDDEDNIFTNIVICSEAMNGDDYSLVSTNTHIATPYSLEEISNAFQEAFEYKGS